MAFTSYLGMSLYRAIIVEIWFYLFADMIIVWREAILLIFTVFTCVCLLFGVGDMVATSISVGLSGIWAIAPFTWLGGGRS